MTVAQLQKEIAKLTGRVPVSTNRRYLEQRLHMLQQRAEDGHSDVADPSPSVVMSISMPSSVKDALAAMADRERIPISRLVRRALAEYAASHRKHRTEATNLAAEQEHGR